MAFISKNKNGHLLVSGFLAVAMAATVGIALAFQHIGGYMPCKLCLEQRVPYYIGAPLMAVAFVTAWLGTPKTLTRGLLLIGALLMLWSLYLGGFHAGVEWGWWEGPSDCAVIPPSTGGGNLLDQLNAIIPPSCDQAAGRFLGLSFAGWNVVASTVLAIIAFAGAKKR